LPANFLRELPLLESTANTGGHYTESAKSVKHTNYGGVGKPASVSGRDCEGERAEPAPDGGESLARSLWTQESSNLEYPYVMTIAAQRAGHKDLDEGALPQLVEVSGNSTEFHLFMGKAHLNLEQYDMALNEIQTAVKADPKLTFVHFNPGLTYLKKQPYEQARAEFLKDAAIEPDVALNYDQLGDVYALMEQDCNTEKRYRGALRRDPRAVAW
jgi:tetratricopeptide (TPR) repeat protein